MFDIKGEYKITLPPNPVFSGNRKIGKYFNRKIFFTDRRATPSLSRSCYRHRCEYLPTIGDRSHPRSLAPVCFNLFRVMIPTPQRNTGDRGDRNSTHRLLPTGSLLYVCASSSGRHHREDRDTGGRQAHRLALSPLYASISFGLPPNPVFWRKVITACYSL